MDWAIVATTVAGIAFFVLAGMLRRRSLSRTRSGGRAPAAASASRASQPGEMETLAQASTRLTRAGYADTFQARRDGLFAARAQKLYAPEDLTVDEVVRFEGASDPQDEAVLFALRSADGGVRGTFTTAYGPGIDAASGEMTRRLHLVERPDDRTHAPRPEAGA